MATYCPEDLVSRELSCPICFEDYDIQDVKRTPKLLLCLHTFCYDCAKKLWRNDGSIECSLCRMLHEEVRLDDLLDNYVIIQHLRREFEERDLELARRIDQHLRDLDRLASAPASDAAQAPEDNKVFEVVDSPPLEQVDISSEQDQQEEEEEAEEENAEEHVEDDEERRYILSNFLQEFMEGFSPSPVHINMGEDDDDDDDDDNDNDSVDGDADNDSNESEEIQEVDAQEESYNEEGNPVFSLANIQSLFGDSEDDNGDNESTHEQENTSNTFPVIPIQAVFNMSDNEENDGDEEEEEDERWHSASDDINVVCWANRESMPMADVNEMEDTTPDIFDWHIISSENFLDD